MAIVVRAYDADEQAVEIIANRPDTVASPENPEPQPPVVAVRVWSHGQVQLGTGFTADSASRAFWDDMARLLPGLPPGADGLASLLDDVITTATNAGGQCDVAKVAQVRDTLRQGSAGAALLPAEASAPLPLVPVADETTPEDAPAEPAEPGPSAPTMDTLRRADPSLADPS